MKPALLIIDMEKNFLKYNEIIKESMITATHYINPCIELFREKNLPIIFIIHEEIEWKGKLDESAYEVIDELNSKESDLKIRKNYYNAFKKTNLLDHIKSNKIDTVIITGVSAEVCVLSTYMGAEDLELNPIILKDSLATSRPRFLPLLYELCEVISYKILEKILNNNI